MADHPARHQPGRSPADQAARVQIVRPEALHLDPGPLPGFTLGAKAEGLEVVPVAEAEDRKRAEALRRRVPAYALIRAMVTQDKEAAVLMVDQARTAGSLDLLAFNMASVAAEALGLRGVRPGAGSGRAGLLDGVRVQWRAQRRACPGRRGMTAPAPQAEADEALAAFALIRAYAARDMYTARHILARWDTRGPGRVVRSRGR